MKRLLKSLEVVTTSMIGKNELKGKYVTFIDNEGKWRTQRVVKVTGNYLTVINAVKVRKRVHLEKVIGRQYRKRGIEEIKWKNNGGKGNGKKKKRTKRTT